LQLFLLSPQSPFLSKSRGDSFLPSCKETSLPSPPWVNFFFSIGKTFSGWVFSFLDDGLFFSFISPQRCHFSSPFFFRSPHAFLFSPPLTTFCPFFLLALTIPYTPNWFSFFSPFNFLNFQFSFLPGGSTCCCPPLSPNGLFFSKFDFSFCCIINVSPLASFFPFRAIFLSPSLFF